MPTYVYRRPDGTTFEVFQRITDDALKTDPETGVPVERVIGGGAGLIFKGTGFYETDYVRKSGTPKAEEAATATPDASTSEAAKPESKGDGGSTKSDGTKASGD